MSKERKLEAIQKVGLFVMKREKSQSGDCPMCGEVVSVNVWSGYSGRGRVKMRMIQRGDGQVALTIEEKESHGMHYGPSSGFCPTLARARSRLLAELRKARSGQQQNLARTEGLIMRIESEPRKQSRLAANGVATATAGCRATSSGVWCGETRKRSGT